MIIDVILFLHKKHTCKCKNLNHKERATHVFNKINFNKIIYYLG
jgi:hypothetical protein